MAPVRAELESGDVDAVLQFHVCGIPGAVGKQPHAPLVSDDDPRAVPADHRLDQPLGFPQSQVPPCPLPPFLAAVGRHIRCAIPCADQAMAPVRAELESGDGALQLHVRRLPSTVGRQFHAPLVSDDDPRAVSANHSPDQPLGFLQSQVPPRPPPPFLTAVVRHIRCAVTCADQAMAPVRAELESGDGALQLHVRGLPGAVGMQPHAPLVSDDDPRAVPADHCLDQPLGFPQSQLPPCPPPPFLAAVVRHIRCAVICGDQTMSTCAVLGNCDLHVLVKIGYYGHGPYLSRLNRKYH